MHSFGSDRQIDLSGRRPFGVGPTDYRRSPEPSMRPDYPPPRSASRYDPEYNDDFQRNRSTARRELGGEQDRRKLSHYFRKFAERTSLQGIPYIYVVKKTYRKVLWSILFILMTLATIGHLTLLIITFLKFDTTSSITLQRTNLDFPSITICNLNPIMASRIRNASENLYEMNQDLAPSGSKRKKRQTETGQNLDGGFYGSVSNVGLVNEEYLDFGHTGDDDNSELYGEGSVSAIARIYESFHYYVGELTKGTRLDIGHSPDLIISCQFNGRVCSQDNFESTVTRDYGNCFTFNSAALRRISYKSLKSGKDLGLQLIIYTQEVEYLDGLTFGRGIKVAMHRFGTMANLANSISLAPGFETFLGLKLVNVSRLGSPYGECNDDGEYEQRFNFSYTLESCLNTCNHRLIADTCRCYQGEYMEYYSDNDLATLDRCDSDSDYSCIRGVTNSTDENPCDCHQACDETRYESDSSMNTWPDIGKWDDLVSEVCSRFGENGTDCVTLTSVNENDEEYVLRRNFLKLNIYYEDLTYELIKEEASYEVSQFASDLGGVFGLWIGASILSLCEVIDLFFSICLSWCRNPEDKYRRHRRHARHVTEYDGTGYRGDPRMDYGGKGGPPVFHPGQIY